jgi:hypothetical protein
LSQERAITTTGQLLVEGRTSEMFFREMIDACNLSARLEARTFGDVGKKTLQTWLEMFTRKPAFEEKIKRLGIIRDAESSPAAAAFQSIQSALKAAGLTAPSRMNALEGAPLAVSVFVLPNCQDAGMLETLCLEAAAESEQGRPDAVFPCVNEFFACLGKSGRNSGNLDKARFAGYALARDVIDPQLGRAAQKGAISWNVKAFEPLKVFLQSIAGSQ